MKKTDRTYPRILDWKRKMKRFTLEFRVLPENRDKEKIKIVVVKDSPNVVITCGSWVYENSIFEGRKFWVYNIFIDCEERKIKVDLIDDKRELYYDWLKKTQAEMAV